VATKINSALPADGDVFFFAITSGFPFCSSFPGGHSGGKTEVKVHVEMLVVAVGLFLMACRGNGDSSLAETAAVPDPQRLGERIDAIAETALRDGPVAGLSIAIFRGSEPVFAKGYGFADVETGLQATADTKYDIASVSKLFTALAVMRLVEEGAVSLDDDLATLLPAFPNPEQARRISVRQLLNHTSGLNDYLAADFVRLLHSEIPTALSASFVLDYLDGRALDADPGTEWQYNNSGFYLAGLIIEQVTGQRWGDYVQDAIARPLGLHDTLSCDELRPDQRAFGYEPGGAGFERNSMYAEAGVQGDGGLCSTAQDLARLPAALAGQRLISEARIDEMLRPTILVDGIAVDYGLGVRLGRLDRHPVWGHTGSFLLAYASTLAHYPDDDVTIAVLVNTTNTAADALVVEGLVVQEVLGLTHSITEGTKLSHAASMYAGEYIGDRYYDIQAILDGAVPYTRERFDIVEKDGHVERTVLTGDERPALKLVYEGNHSFGRADWPMDRFVFHVEEGLARGYSEYYNGIFATFNRRVRPVQELPPERE
jgi:D-alanyl-D-alanine carboxypeptidase